MTYLYILILLVFVFCLILWKRIMDIDKITAEGIFTLSNMIDDQRMEIKKIKNTLIQHLENDVKLMDGIRDKMNKLNGGNE